MSLRDFINQPSEPEKKGEQPEKKAPPRKTQAAKKKKPVEKKKPAEEKKQRKINIDKKNDIDDLSQKASRAQLEDMIYKADISKYKSERAKMDIEKEAGVLIEFDMAKFLFFGYMEKINLQLLGMMKRNEARVENLVKERDRKGLEKLVNREIKNIIIDIKKQQQKDVKSWEQTR